MYQYELRTQTKLSLVSHELVSCECGFVIVTAILLHPKRAEDKSQVRTDSLPHNCVAQLISKSRICDENCRDTIIPGHQCDMSGAT